MISPRCAESPDRYHPNPERNFATARAYRRFVIAFRVTVGYEPGFLMPKPPGLRLTATVRSGGACLWAVRCLPGGSGKIGGDDVGGVPVKAAAGPVVAHRRARVGMRGGFLDVAERNPGVEGGGDERVPQGVRPDRLGDPGADGHPPDDPSRAVPVQPLPIGTEEDRPFQALADGQVDRPRGAGCQRNGDDLAALARDNKSPMPALDAQVLDAGACGSETRSPLSASSEISACSLGELIPEATSSAPSSLRSRPVACDS
jgi:hypothetical protein